MSEDPRPTSPSPRPPIQGGSDEGAPPFHPDWRRKVDRALTGRVLCLDCMCAQLDIPKRYLADYLAWMKRNVVIIAKRPCEVCLARVENYGYPKDRVT